ncbi:uncharacterized protein LOC134279157 [Saccostrea cucullata]|uniref:uncharacterized protein LOC134279157 n=1 Tax=Saccostrea cuccullata TaxID=36930 RepID=UPI002ED328E8
MSWKINEHDLILSDESENYSGGTMDDSCLRIRSIKDDNLGTYECTVRNMFGEMTIHYILDEIQCSSKACQSFLLCCLLLNKCRARRNEPDEWEEKLKLCWKFCCADDEKDITERVFAAISNGKLKDHIYCKNNEYGLQSPDKIFKRFLQMNGFVDFYLQHACSQNIGIYCRSPEYSNDQDETCCIVSLEQFRVVVQRLKFDILTHFTIKDKAFYPIIEEVLNIPQGIVGLGSKGISKYLEDLSKGDHKVYVARGMLVGCEGAGKTSLLCRLTGKDNPYPSSTRGIDVHANVFTVHGEKLEVTTNPNKATLRSNLSQEDRPEDKNNAESDDANQLSVKSFENKNIEGDKFSTKILQTLAEKNDQQVAEITNQIEVIGNENSSENVYMDVTDEDKILTDDSPSVDSNVTTSDEINIVRKYSFSRTLSESFENANNKIVTIFDFAGQFAYYACHHLYFSPNDFYILVMDITKRLDARVSTAETGAILHLGGSPEYMSDGRSKMEGSMFYNWTYLEYIKYWLQSILSHSAGVPAAMKEDNKLSTLAPLILVATHAEEKTEKEVEAYFQDLRDKFPKMSVHIDYNNAFCTSYYGQNKDLEEIRHGIVRVVQTLPNWGTRIPLSWFNVENLVRTLSSLKIIKTDELLINCRTNTVGIERKDDLKTPLLFLHNIGVVLFFDEENLRDFVIIDVQWFVHAFKNVITDENHAKRDIPQDLYEKWKMFNNNGLLTSSLLSSIWRKCEQNDEYNAKKTEIISMMIKLNVLTEITTSTSTTMPDMWYCPCMNKQRFPTSEFQNLRNSSLLCFMFNFLPNGFFHRLIAACGNILKWPILKMKSLCIYQTATVFHIEKSKVLIGMHSNNMILIQYLDLPDSESADYLGIRGKVTNLIEGLIEKLVNCVYEVGYMCEKRVFGKSNISLTHFIAESDMKEEVINCSYCGFSRKVSVKDIIWTEKQKNLTDTEKENMVKEDDTEIAVSEEERDMIKAFDALLQEAEELEEYERRKEAFPLAEDDNAQDWSPDPEFEYDNADYPRESSSEIYLDEEAEPYYENFLKQLPSPIE